MPGVAQNRSVAGGPRSLSNAAEEPGTISFGATVGLHVTEPQLITNTLLIDDGQGRVLSRSATAIANGLASYLPAIYR